MATTQPRTTKEQLTFWIPAGVIFAAYATVGTMLGYLIILISRMDENFNSESPTGSEVSFAIFVGLAFLIFGAFPMFFARVRQFDRRVMLLVPGAPAAVLVTTWVGLTIAVNLR